MSKQITVKKLNEISQRFDAVVYALDVEWSHLSSFLYEALSQHGELTRKIIAEGGGNKLPETKNN